MREARVITTLTDFRPDFRPRTILAIRARGDGKGKPVWYQITIPGRPNGRSGWVPAASVDLKPVDRWLVIFRRERRFSLVLRGSVVRSGPVAIGAPGMETPLGLFFVQAIFRPTANSILGAYAFETSGYSRLSDWPGGGVVSCMEQTRRSSSAKPCRTAACDCTTGTSCFSGTSSASVRQSRSSRSAGLDELARRLECERRADTSIRRRRLEPSEPVADCPGSGAPA